MEHIPSTFVVYKIIESSDLRYVALLGHIYIIPMNKYLDLVSLGFIIKHKIIDHLPLNALKIHRKLRKIQLKTANQTQRIQKRSQQQLSYQWLQQGRTASTQKYDKKYIGVIHTQEVTHAKAPKILTQLTNHSILRMIKVLI